MVLSTLGRFSPVALRRAAWVLCSVPLALLISRALTESLGANPVETLERELGIWALIFLMCSLSVTPLRVATGRTELAPLRRTLGLAGFWYAALHVLVYAVLDRVLLWSEVLLDLTKRPYVMLGAVAFTALLVLAVTSPKAVVRRLGGARWKRVHLLAYCAAPLAATHFLWLKLDKNLWERPALYGAGVLVILAARWVIKAPVRAPASPR